MRTVDRRIPAYASPVSERVAGLDAGFLLTETSTTLWHICGVLVLDPSTAPVPFGVESVRELVAARLDRIEAFHKVVESRCFGLLPHWADADVDLVTHVLPAPTGGAHVADVARLAARVAETPLDRHEPLWQLHVVERMADGRAAVVAKVHHALADGVTAVGLLAGLLDLEPLSPRPPAIELGMGDAGPTPAPRRLPRQAVAAGRAAIHAAVGAAQLVVRTGRRYSFAFGGARTSGHAALTTRRDVGLVSLPVDPVRRVRAAFGVTFHDTVLAAVTGALRVWLADAGQLPDRPLVAVVPTSIPAADAGPGTHNRVSALFVSLPVQIDDAVDRLRAIADDASRSKHLHEAAGPETLGSLAAVAPWRTLSALWRAAWWLGTAHALPPVANLIVTSVPGPPVPLYLAGARLVGLYPLGPILEGVPVNVTAISREDRVEIGIMTCPDLVAPAPALASYVPAALDELVAAIV